VCVPPPLENDMFPVSHTPSLSPSFLLLFLLQICTLVADKENVGDGVTKCEGLKAYSNLQEVREGGREGGRKGGREGYEKKLKGREGEEGVIKADLYINTNRSERMPLR